MLKDDTFGKPFQKVFQAPFGGELSDYDRLLSLRSLHDPLVVLDSLSIEDSGGVITNWANAASGVSAGGANYDMSAVTGSPVVDTQQGKRVARFNGSSQYMKSAAEQTILNGYTVMAVAKGDIDTSNMRLFSEHTGVGAYLVANFSGGTWFAYSGTGIAVSNLDTDVNLHQYVAQGPGSSYAVYNSVEGSEVGNSGTNDLLYLTLAANKIGVSFWEGWIGALYIWDKVLTDGQLKDVRNNLLRLWRVGL